MHKPIHHQKKQKRYYNRQGRSLKPIEQGDTVRICLPGRATLTCGVCKVLHAMKSKLEELYTEGISCRSSQQGNKQTLTYHWQVLHRKMGKVVVITYHKKTQAQNYMHRVHQESSACQFPVGQIEHGSHLDEWMTMCHHDSTLVNVGCYSCLFFVSLVFCVTSYTCTL